MYERLNARNASRAIMRSSSVGTTSTATFESSVEMLAILSPLRFAVAFIVKRNAHALQALQCQGANHCASLADAAGENHRIESAHGCDVSADVLSHAIAVSFERDQSALMTLIGRSKNFAHVA